MTGPQDSDRDDASETASQHSDASTLHADDELYALHRAAEAGNVDAVKLLLENGHPVDERDDRGRTPLLTATQRGNLDVAVELMQRGADVNAKDGGERAVLSYAASSNCVSLVAKLMRGGAAVDAQDAYGMTALMLAASSRFTDVALELLRNGAAVDLLENEEGRTALSFAATGNAFPIAVALIDKGAKVDAVASSGRTPLLDAALHDNLEIVVELLRCNASVDIKDANGRSALSLAAACGNVQVAAALIENGAVVNDKDLQGRMPLSYAAKNGYAELVTEFLHSYGAEVDARDEQGVTALMRAAAKGHEQIIEELLQNGAAVNARSEKGRVALSYAAKKGHVEVITSLIKRGALIGEYDSDGRSALAYAAANGHGRVVAELLHHGAFDASSSSADQVSLFVAAALGDQDQATQLLTKGGSVDTMTKDGRTPLFYAAECGQLEMVAVLIENGATVQATARASEARRECETPLTLAGRAGHMKVFRALVKRGASVNVQSGVDGETPLISAARWDFLAGVQLLMAHGGRLREEDVTKDETPLIPGSLETMRQQFCGATLEFEGMCSRVLERMGGICSQLQRSDLEENQAGNLVSFASIIFRFCRLLLEIEKRKSPLSRFISSRALADRVRDFHEELDHFVTMARLASNGEGWKAQLGEDQSSLHDQFQSLLSSDHVLMERIARDAQKRELALLLQYELKTRDGERTPEVYKGMKSILERFVRLCEIDAPSVPDWFLSRDDLEFHRWNIISEANVTTYDGKWKQTRVTIETSNFEEETFGADAAQWYQLNHPHIVKFFGACTIGEPKVIVYETVPKGRPLHEFLNGEENRGSMWKCLYEAALGLQYLHKRNVVHKGIRGENIIVGSDSTTKLGGVGESPYKHYFDKRSGLHWMSPECVRSLSSVSIAADIYAFGMCIWEAVTQELPWKHADTPVISEKVSEGELPERPVSMDDAVWNLIAKMCAFDPSERVSIEFAVNRLKQFLLESEQVQDSAVQGQTLTPSGANVQVQPRSLDEHAFAELEGATIPSTLQTILMKAERLQDSQWMAKTAYPALEYIFGLLREQQKLPTDIEVVKFCGTLSRFQRYLRTAVSEKSVLALVRSRQVAESHSLIYSELDRLMDLLDVPQTDPIRVWRRGAAVELAQEPGVSDETATADDNPPKGNDSSSAVSLNHIDPLSPSHVPWTQAGLAAALPALPSWYLSLQDLVFSESDAIGQGAFGTVYRGSWLDTPVVIKFMGYDEDFGTISTELLLHEVRVWHRLSHPHVLKLYGACHVDKRYFVCEFASNGDLTKYLAKPGNERLTWQMMYEAALGLQYLHGLGIAHNDLKCDNIMVGMDGRAKLIDFGLSCLLGEAEIQIEVKKMGAVHWKSPEYLAGGRPSCASDVYSFAMCIIEVVSGEIPWGKSILPPMIRYKVKKGSIPPLPESMNEKQRNLIQLMTKQDPGERVRMAFVVNKLSEIAQDAMAP